MTVRTILLPDCRVIAGYFSRDDILSTQTRTVWSSEMKAEASSSVEIMPAARGLDAQILSEQVRLIYKQGPTLAGGATCAAFVTGFFLWSETTVSIICLWLAGICCAGLVRIRMFRQYWSASEGIHSARRWGQYFALGSFFSGSVWGLWPFLFYSSYSADYLLLVSTIFAGMIAVLATSGSVYLPAFYAFAVPLITPLIFFHVNSANPLLVSTGWLLVMFFFVNLSLAIRGNRHYCELIEARFRNTELMRQLAREKWVAETAVVSKNRFIATASHDLRQPLHAISLFAAALGNTKVNSKQASIVSDIERSTEALNQLFDSLLDVSRLEADTIEVGETRFALQPLFDTLSTDFIAAAAAKGISLSLPESDAIVRTDRMLLERILRNLLSNAVRYTHEGGVRVVVETVGDQHVCVSVVDSGVGIARDELELVFDEYHQVQGNTVEQQHGMGLGLSIVKGLCEKLDLRLRVESEPGVGSRFELQLGTAIDCDDLLGRTNHLPGKSLAARILVIDDERSILDATEILLQNWGCEVITASDKAETLRAIADNNAPPDFLLSDYRLPGDESGIDVVHLVRDWLGCEVPAVIITGDTSPERLAEVAASGLPLLHKPLVASDLKFCIQEMVTKYRSNLDIAI